MTRKEQRLRKDIQRLNAKIRRRQAPRYKRLSLTCKLTDEQATHAVEDALLHLTIAVGKLKEAGCPKTLARVRLALSSCKGALRNVAHRKYQRERRVG